MTRDQLASFSVGLFIGWLSACFLAITVSVRVALSAANEDDDKPPENAGLNPGASWQLRIDRPLVDPDLVRDVREFGALGTGNDAATVQRAVDWCAAENARDSGPKEAS